MKEFINKNFTIITFIILMMLFLKGCNDTRRLNNIDKLLTEKLKTNTNIIDVQQELREVENRTISIEYWVETVNGYENLNEKEKILGEINLLKAQNENLKIKLENLKKNETLDK